jgi:tetratricopeptide (TPR) repeat protein
MLWPRGTIAAFIAVGLAAGTALAHPGIHALREGIRAEAPRHEGDPDFDLVAARADRIAGDFDAALEAIARAEGHGADPIAILIERGDVFAAAGWDRTAYRYFDRAVAAAPDLPEARFRRARILVKLGRPAKAARDFEQALAAVSSSPLATPPAPWTHCRSASSAWDHWRRCSSPPSTSRSS